MCSSDLWRDGKLVRRGRRDCAGRYEAIRDALEREIGTGFTVADVGGWDGYFPVRLAEDLDATAENIDPRRINLRCHRQLKVTAETVDQVGFHDAILCLSVLHHMPDWLEVYEGLKAQCRILIVEVCHPDEAAGDSPVMQLTGERIAPVFEAVSADAEDILCETPCLDDKRILRPTYLIHGVAWTDEADGSGEDEGGGGESGIIVGGPDSVVIGDKGAERVVVGIVESGSGKAAELMGEEDLDWSPLGYEPFPGTLNVAVSEEDRDWLKSLPGVEAPGLRRSTHYVPVRIPGVTVAADADTAVSLVDVEAHVHFARSPAGRQEKVIELVAPVELRTLRGYQDGDTIEVKPR